ncbi:MAG: mucoidy inhibitor MuiA family protein, partial [Leptospira sp.]|nr:mucoidy inhibitor MuiA family protein [Leptospira sp.]
VARTGGSFTFNASETATIPTGKESHRILISRFTSNSSEELAAIPKLSRFVYTTEKIKNKISFPLLPGKANLIKDSGYVGETSIPYFPPGNEFTISYGIENTIRLSYKTENRNDTEGIVTNRKLTNKNVIITIENFDNSQKTINLSDQVPVSDIEEVEIEINRTKTTPGYTEKIKNSGILHWVITIPPNSKKEVILNFNIRTPANSNLNF